MTTCTGIVGFDQEMGFNQRFLANIAGNVWGSVHIFFPILCETYSSIPQKGHGNLLGQLCCVMVPDSASILELQVDLELGRFLLYYYV